MVAAIKLLHLLEAFSTSWFLLSAPSNHHLVFFLLEIFNNIIQYQFDGNANLVYTIIRKRHVFHALANLPSDFHGISKCLSNRKIAIGGASNPNISNRIKPTSQTTSFKPDEKVEPNNEVVAPSSAIKPLPSPNESTENNSPATQQFNDDDQEDFNNLNLESKSDLSEEVMEGSRPAQPAEPGTLKGKHFFKNKYFCLYL